MTNGVKTGVTSEEEEVLKTLKHVEEEAWNTSCVNAVMVQASSSPVCQKQLCDDGCLQK